MQHEVSVMKAKFLIGVAVLLMTAGAADAVELPKEMLGKWCRKQLATWFDTYTRSTCEKDDDAAIIIHKDHYVETHYYDDSCTFSKIDKIGSGAYLIYSHCKEPKQNIIEEAEIIDGQLVIRNIPES